MSTSSLHKKLPELITLERVIKSLPSTTKVDLMATVCHRGTEFPLYSIVLGSPDKTAPCLGVFGGVHGLERIGSDVVIAWLHTIAEALQWDETLHEKLQKSRLVFMPMVNPVGIYRQSRSNGNGVDLMRNAPVTAEEEPAFLLGGHRLSARLPWFRGQVSQQEDMEVEAQALCRLVQNEVLPSKLALTVDVHSGFGSVDRLWFPYAKTRRPPPNIAEIASLKRLFDRNYPNHFYRIEPQAKQYTTHGDLWDYLYDHHLQTHPSQVYIPWTLELGSWLWLKKNPRQLFSALGPFNPLQPHRLQRILRRHFTLFDFLHRAVMGGHAWSELTVENRQQLTEKAIDHWYGLSK